MTAESPVRPAPRPARPIGPIPQAPQTPCATCGVCCRDYLVPVFGYDVWLISTRQRLGPEAFVIVYPQKEANVDAFRLGAGGPHLGLALDKRGTFGSGKPCVFLVDLAGGHSRCGIYAHRPVACQVYPMALRQGIVSQRPDALCPPGAWPPAAVARPAWRASLQRLRLHWDVYAEVVGRWNARVDAAPAGRDFAVPEYFSFLLNVYAGLAALDDALGRAVMDEVEATWPNHPREPLDPGQLDDPDRAPLWLRYFASARQVIDAFYPEIPPQPPRLQATPPEVPESVAVGP